MTDPIKAFERALQNRPEGISPYTIRGYISDLKKFAEWFKLSTGEQMGLDNVTPVDVRDYKEHLQTVKKYKPATINRRLASLRAFFTWAIEDGLVEENPVRVRNIEEPQTAPRSLDEKTYLAT